MQEFNFGSKRRKHSPQGKTTYPELGYDSDKHDAVSKHVNVQFKACVANRRTEKIGSHSVEDCLWHARYQADNEHEPRDAELIEETGVDIYLPVTSVKAAVVHALTRDMVNSDKDIIRFKPSPDPELNESQELEVVRELRRELATMTQLSPDEIVATTKLIKDKHKQKLIQLAAEDSSRNQRIMRDKLEECRFRHKLSEFVNYLLYYPYAVALFPVEEQVIDREWDGDNIRIKEFSRDVMRVIDPFNYYWSSDCDAANSGYCEVVVDTFSRSELLGIADQGNKDGWRPDVIRKAVDTFSKTQTHHWLRMSRSGKSAVIPWGETDSVEVLRYFGRMPADAVRSLGVKVPTKDVECEVHAIVLGHYTLKLTVVDKATRRKRPTMVSSWQKRPGNLAGKGLAFILRDIQRMVNMAVRHTITNAGFASAPMGEADYKRVAQFYDDPGDIKQPMPGTIIPVNPDLISGSARPAFQFYDVPNHTAQFTNLQTYFLQLADNVSQIPAMLSGVPVGSGAMRTFRGMMQYQANSMRVIQAAFDNIDQDVLEPIGDYYLDKGLKSKEFTGDSRAIAFGLGGLLREELDAQKAGENLQLITQLAGAVPQMVPPGALEWVIRELLGNSGIPEAALNMGGGAGLPPTPVV